MSVRSRSNWNLEVLVFEGRGKPEYPEKNLSEQGREPTTNSTHIWRQRRELKTRATLVGGERTTTPPLGAYNCVYIYKHLESLPDTSSQIFDWNVLETLPSTLSLSLTEIRLSPKQARRVNNG